MVLFAMRVWPWHGRVMAHAAEDMLDDEADLFAPNHAGLPEANLTEEQRREAIRRIKQKPRIG